MSNKGSTAFLVLSTAVLSGSLLFAQSGSSAQASPSQQAGYSLDDKIKMLRRDLRSQRKQIIAENMNLNEAEAVKFWPVYDQYVSELVQGNNAKYEIVKEYAQVDTMSDQQADGLPTRWLTVDENVVQLRRKYLPMFRSVLSAKQTARFFQLDRQVQMMIDLQVASSLPLIEP